MDWLVASSMHACLPGRCIGGHSKERKCNRKYAIPLHAVERCVFRQVCIMTDVGVQWLDYQQDCPYKAGTSHGTVTGRNKNDGWEVMFLDMDWACQDGQRAYPLLMNHRDIMWPEGAATGQPVRQSHDRAFVKRLEARASCNRTPRMKACMRPTWRNTGRSPVRRALTGLQLWHI